MAESELQIRQRGLPHWILDGSTYFVTYRAVAAPLGPDERRLVVEHLRSGDGVYYDLVAAVVMPDHVHLLLRPRVEMTLSRVMKRDQRSIRPVD
jgi:hypothetical protein